MSQYLDDFSGACSCNCCCGWEITPKCRIVRENYGEFADTYTASNIAMPWTLPSGVSAGSLLPLQLTVTQPVVVSQAFTCDNSGMCLVEAVLFFPIDVNALNGTVGLTGFTLSYSRSFRADCMAESPEFVFLTSGSITSQSYANGTFTISVSVSIRLNVIGATMRSANTECYIDQCDCPTSIKQCFFMGTADFLTTGTPVFISPPLGAGATIQSIVPVNGSRGVYNVSGPVINGDGTVSIGFDVVVPINIYYTDAMGGNMVQYGYYSIKGLTATLDISAYSGITADLIDVFVESGVSAITSYTYDSTTGMLTVNTSERLIIVVLSRGSLMVCEVQNTSCPQPTVQVIQVVAPS